jgi:hypothetical protein
MPGFTSYDDLITQITVNGFEDDFNFMKVGGTMQAGGATWYSMYLLAGAPGTGTSVAGAVTSTTANSQNGAIVFPNVSTQTEIYANLWRRSFFSMHYYGI